MVHSEEYINQYQDYGDIDGPQFTVDDFNTMLQATADYSGRTLYYYILNVKYGYIQIAMNVPC